MSNHYYAIVIGSGQGGGPLAQTFANSGKKTALIESTHVGGTCVNEGCTPTKTMIASGRSAYMACGAKSMGIEFKRSSLQLNLETVRERKRDIVTSFRGGSENRIKDTANLDLIMGKAKFVSSNEVEVTLVECGGTKSLTADKIFINAGCSPAPLSIQDAHVIEPGALLTSTSIMELDAVPRHLLVIGGGPIGLEFAQLFRRFGAQVTIVQRAAHLVPNEDEDISLEMEKILVEDGITLHLGAKAKWFSKVPTGSVVLQITTQQGDTKSIFASHVLNATGRPPNTADLNLEAAGVKTTARGHIEVNDFLETSAPDIYALGDIKGGPAFTHISYDDFRVLKHNLITHTTAAPISIKERIVPYCVFTDPQLGRVGLTEKQARNLYPPGSCSNGVQPAPTDVDLTPTSENPTSAPSRIATATMPMSWVARALELNETRGLMKAVIDKETDKILGFACLGIEGGEVMSQVQLAMKGGLTWRDLRDGIFAHPCLAEGLNNLFAQFGDD
ncbi:hypothetical protein PMZ80_009475 [Knufia obscura]|uniref:Mercuric reductase n=2 Tax=Knufia TaxID=430999 RepID=A0AAN8EFL8_9EURO|nr:hypothetical protein PMZ80_009475 [Knufia obscura]KAK5949587.1 hypothetical protein OHC33_009394 [Knufia fluminis]